MKVQLNGNELDNLMRQLRLYRKGKAHVCEIELDVPVEQTQVEAHETCEAISPEEYIQRDPRLALDHVDVVDEHTLCVNDVLRWFHDPAQARGKKHFVPIGHPCGWGGYTVHIPEDFPIPNDAA